MFLTHVDQSVFLMAIKIIKGDEILGRYLNLSALLLIIRAKFQMNLLDLSIRGQPCVGLRMMTRHI